MAEAYFKTLRSTKAYMLTKITQEEWDKLTPQQQLYRITQCKKMEYNPLEYRNIQYDEEYVNHAAIEFRYFNTIKPWLDEYREQEEKRKCFRKRVIR